MSNTLPNSLRVSPLRAAPAGRGVSDGPLRRIRLGDTNVEYLVRRSRQRRKTYQISIVSGQIVVAVPYATTNRQAEDMVLHKAKWILAKLDASVATPEAPAFLSGEKLPYRGRALTLWVQGVAGTDSGQPEVSLERRRLKVAVPMGLEEEEQRRLVGDALMHWFGCRAQEQIGEQMARWLPVLGRGEAPNVQIRNQRRRWGSCSYKGVLRFNWRLAMLEPALTEYVVVHELAHLTHMNHSQDFWGLVEKHLPDVKERRRRLKEQEALLPRI